VQKIILLSVIVQNTKASHSWRKYSRKLFLPNKNQAAFGSIMLGGAIGTLAYDVVQKIETATAFCIA